jgi:uncharacterized RDD family membrane protein YckC
MYYVPINTPFNVSLDIQAAAIYQRIIAYSIDLIIITGYAITVGFFVNEGFLQQLLGSRNTTPSTVWSLLLITLPILFYPLVLELLMHGQTIGKKVSGIRVMSLQGGEPSVSQYATRWLFRFFEWPLVIFGVVFPGFWIAFQLMWVLALGVVVVIIIAVTKYHRRLGDIAANTVLVKTKSRLSINDTIFKEITEKNYQVQFPTVMQLIDKDINIIKSVLVNSGSKSGQALTVSTAIRVATALKIQTNLSAVAFLSKLLEDYNYLATKE